MMRVFGLPCDHDWLRVPPVSGGFRDRFPLPPRTGQRRSTTGPPHPRAVGGCAGTCRAHPCAVCWALRAEASGEASVRGSSGERTCSGGARPEKGMGGFPGTGEVHGASRATPRNHATRVSTEPARSTPSRMTPALTRDRSGIACCAPLYVVRPTRASTTPATTATTATIYGNDGNGDGGGDGRSDGGGIDVRSDGGIDSGSDDDASGDGDGSSNGGSHGCIDGGSDGWRQWQGRR